LPKHLQNHHIAFLEADSNGLNLSKPGRNESQAENSKNFDHVKPEKSHHKRTLTLNNTEITRVEQNSQHTQNTIIDNSVHLRNPLNTNMNHPTDESLFTLNTNPSENLPSSKKVHALNLFVIF
jgi:hypothetical protein